MPVPNNKAISYFFASHPYLLCVINRQTTILQINTSFCKALGKGCQQQNLVGKQLVELMHTEDKQCLYQQLGSLLDGSVETIAFRARLKNESDVNTTVDWTGIFDSEQDLYLLTGRIANAPDDKQQLCLNEQDFNYFFYNSLDGMLVSHLDGTIISANPSFCRMLGRTEEQVRQAHYKDFIDLSDPNVKSSLQKWRETDPYQGEINYIHQDGHIIPTEITIKTYREKCGKELVGTIVRNLSEKIKTQQQIDQLDRLNLIGQLAAGIGHEVRNPLTVIRGFIQLLSDKRTYQADKPYFDMILHELDRASSIITDFLSLAQVQPTKMEKENLNDIIQGLYPLIQSDALHMDQNISFHPQAIPAIMLNKREIHQLILNLVRNGLEAMTTKGQMKIATYMEDGKIVMAVSDTGTGIDQTMLSQLGTPFVTTKKDGTGLGLATCFSIAKRNNAYIDVKTNAVGTTFYVHFNVPETTANQKTQE